MKLLTNVLLLTTTLHERSIYTATSRGEQSNMLLVGSNVAAGVSQNQPGNGYIFFRFIALGYKHSGKSYSKYDTRMAGWPAYLKEKTQYILFPAHWPDCYHRLAILGQAQLQSVSVLLLYQAAGRVSMYTDNEAPQSEPEKLVDGQTTRRFRRIW